MIACPLCGTFQEPGIPTRPHSEMSECGCGRFSVYRFPYFLGWASLDRIIYYLDVGNARMYAAFEDGRRVVLVAGWPAYGLQPSSQTPDEIQEMVRQRIEELRATADREDAARVLRVMDS